MDDETKPIVDVFQHSNSISTQTKTSDQSSRDSYMSLKRRLESELELPVPLKKHDNSTLKRGEVTSKSSALNSMDSERFIEEIMKRPGIWDPNNMNYKDKFKVKSLWEGIHRKFPDVSVDDLKKRWKNLKDAYRKELRRLQKQNSIDDLKAKPSWRYFDQLSFLKDSLRGISYECKDNETDACGQEASSNSPIFLCSEDEEEENESVPNESDIKAELLKMERKKMWILEEEIAKRNQYMNSDNYHFLMSLLPEMNKLSPVQKMRLRTKISQAVLDEVSGSLHENEKVVEEDEHQPPPSPSVIHQPFEEENQEIKLEQEVEEDILFLSD